MFDAGAVKRVTGIEVVAAIQYYIGVFHQVMHTRCFNPLLEVVDTHIGIDFDQRSAG